MTHDPHTLYPADIAPIARALDDLGEAERQAAGAELEAGVVGAIESARRPAALRLSTPSATPSVTTAAGGSGHSGNSAARTGWAASGRMRLAASVAIVAGGLAAWLALNPAPAPVGPAPLNEASLEQEVEAWLALAGPDDELRAEIEVMLLQSADLARGLDAGWIEDDLIGESL